MIADGMLCTVAGAEVVSVAMPWEFSMAPSPVAVLVARAEWPKSVKEYAVFLGKSAHTISKRIRNGVLGAKREPGENTLITLADHERYATGQRAGVNRERRRF